MRQPRVFLVLLSLVLFVAPGGLSDLGADGCHECYRVEVPNANGPDGICGLCIDLDENVGWGICVEFCSWPHCYTSQFCYWDYFF